MWHFYSFLFICFSDVFFSIKDVKFVFIFLAKASRNFEHRGDVFWLVKSVILFFNKIPRSHIPYRF